MKTPSLNENKMLWIQCYCWFYDFLSAVQKKSFMELLDQFVGEKTFIGVGIDITDEMKIAIAGWAVLLVLNRPLGVNWYRHIESISIYPDKTIPPDGVYGLVEDGGPYCLMHLAWKEVRDNATKAISQGNTILHEFAHALDQINRDMNGFPEVLLSAEEQSDWRRVFCAEYFFSRSKRCRKQLWDFFELYRWKIYNPSDISCIEVSEMFAVSTEMFFERPEKLQRKTPEVYNCLMALYKFNPAIDFQKQAMSDR